jgi:hypothetical protein
MLERNSRHHHSTQAEQEQPKVSAADRGGKRRGKIHDANPTPLATSEPSGNATPRKPSIGVGWSSHFERPGLQSFFYRKLRYAYRAPTFFLEAMLANNVDVKFLRFDEALACADLDGTTGQLAESADLVYFASHGEYKAHGYSFILHGSDWRPCAKGLGTGSLSVAVFDTCDLVDLSDPSWRNAWISSAGSHLRLLLGFASPATVATNSTIRGKGFAEQIIAGDPLGPAWLHAVHDTAYAGADVGVAIGFGDDRADAEWALHKMTLADLPRPRSSASPPVTVEEVCH